MKSTMLVPFGKYKGQPVEVLAQDEQYLEWLSAQDWFKEKYQNIYAIIINNFNTPSDTPEHNKIQVRFLNDDYRFKIAFLLASGKARRSLDFETSVDFEVDGLDVLINTSHNCFEKAIDIYIEIKPTVGDDYPAILRQIRNSGAYRKYQDGDFGTGADRINGIKFCLLIDDYSGSIGREALKEYFSVAAIRVLFVSDADQVELEFSESEDEWKLLDKPEVLLSQPTNVVIDVPSLPSNIESGLPNDQKKTDGNQLPLFP